METINLENLKSELEDILRRQSKELNRFARKISDNPTTCEKETLEIALKLSDQALIHGTRTRARLNEVIHISLVTKVD